MNKVLELIKMTDEEFYDKYLADASLEEVAEFMKEFPEFLECEGTEEMDQEMFEAIRKEIHELDELA